MVHTFKFSGQRMAYDSVSGLTLPLSELAYKMLDYIELPMPKECSSALRYDLAKFDSTAVSETYGELYTLYSEGKLFAEEKTEDKCTCGGAVVAVGDRLCCGDDPHVLDMAKELAECGCDTAVRVIYAPCGVTAISEEELPSVLKELEKLCREQIKRAKGEIEGKPFTAFARCAPSAHTEKSCVGCWANKLCSLDAPMSIMCELEKKRIECVMMCENAVQA